MSKILRFMPVFCVGQYTNGNIISTSDPIVTPQSQVRTIYRLFSSTTVSRPVTTVCRPVTTVCRPVTTLCRPVTTLCERPTTIYRPAYVMSQTTVPHTHTHTHNQRPSTEYQAVHVAWRNAGQ